MSSWWDWVVENTTIIRLKLEQIIWYLNPINWWYEAIAPFFAWLQTVLPAPADMSDVFDAVLTFWYYIRPIYALADNFINIPIFAFVLGFILIIELSLVGPSLWRFLLKMIPALG